MFRELSNKIFVLLACCTLIICSAYVGGVFWIGYKFNLECQSICGGYLKL